MPQMAPMNWLTLFMMFIMMFIIFNLLNYYIFMKTEKQTSPVKKINNYLNWKW